MAILFYSTYYSVTFKGISKLYYLKRPSKKRLIAVLMFVCCVASTILLVSIHTDKSKTLSGLTEADSLLQLAFQKYNFKKDQITSWTTTVDSSFTRKNYVISVKPNFPQTRFHTTIRKQFYPYHIKTPAQVIFPKKDLHFLVVYHQTIIATVNLKTHVKKDSSTQ